MPAARGVTLGLPDICYIIPILQQKGSISMSDIQGFEAVAAYREILGWDIRDLSLERPWTRDHTDYLVELYKRGWTFKQVAAEMKRTQGYIAGKVFDLAEDDIITPQMWGTKAKGKAPRGPLEVEA